VVGIVCRFSEGRDPSFSKPFPPDLSTRLSAVGAPSELGRAFATGGTSRVRFEIASSNLFNIENLDVPNTNVTSSAFGRVTASQTVDQAGPRTIQFSLRYSF
jgi:hypothetical protein